MSVRGVSRLVVALSATASLVACGAEPDLAKASYPRTTVPAAVGGSTASTGAPRTNDPAFAADKLRELEPCELLDRDTLATVGTPGENRPSNFDQCFNSVRDRDGKELNLTLTVGDRLLEDPGKADKNIGGLPAIESELDDRTACFVTAITETSPNLGIKIQIGGAAENMCEAGATVLESVVNRIRTDPPKRDGKQGTLAFVDPCGLVAEADITAVLGAGATSTPSSLHWCTWSQGGADIWIWLRTGVDPVKTADPNKEQRVDVGVPAVQELETSSTAQCAVVWPHLPLEDDFAEVVDVTFVRYTPQQGEDVCGKAQAVARALVPKLPKK